MTENRHGLEKTPQSYWMASTPTTEYPQLTGEVSVDVAVIGGGMAGISCAYLLGKEGVKSAVIEADRILQGTTGHTTAKITSQHELIYSQLKGQKGVELAKQYADANESAIRLIEKTAKELKIDCDLVPQSAYVYTQQDKYVEKIQEEAETASSLGIKAALVDEIPFPIPIKTAVRFDGQAQFHPRKYLLALAREIVKSGNQIYEQSRVVDIEDRENGGYTLLTRQGKRVICKKVVIASHYPMYNKAGLYFTRIYSDRSYVLAIKAREKYPGGMYITAEDPARSLRNQASENGELILVVGEHHKTGQGGDTGKYYEALLEFARYVFTVEDIPYRWSTQDCMTLDGVPYVGYFTKDTPDMYIATGFQKWGMTNSTASAVIIKDLIVHGRSPWADVYDPSRQTSAASIKNFVTVNLDVAKHLIAGKVSPLPEDVDLEPGEARVIEAEGQRAGAYRDEQGTLHLVNTTCTHMGCELNWNSAETSWDCPCHGSRFSCEGDVIEGPAVSPLTEERDVDTIVKLIKDQY